MSSVPAVTLHPLVPLHATLVEADALIAQFHKPGHNHALNALVTTTRNNLKAQAVVVEVAIESTRKHRANVAADAFMAERRAKEAATQVVPAAVQTQEGGAL